MNKSLLELVVKNNSHAILIIKTEGCSSSNFIKSFFKEILKKHIKDKETLRQLTIKLNEKKYYDWLEFNGLKKTIKKEDILSIKNQFSHSGLESCDCKFYVLDNLEFSTLEANNSLLKFLEEPNENVYCVITCSNEAKILKTIVSRCQKIRLTTDNNDLNDIKKKHKFNKWQKIVYLQSFTDLDELEQYLQSESFNKLDKILEVLITSKLEIENLKLLSEEFKNLTYSEIHFITNCLISISQANKKSQLLELLENLRFNPIKILFFYEIIEILKGEKNV